VRTVVESGEVLVRRRFRRVEDGFPLPMQIQILEPDFLDLSKDVPKTASGGRIVQGVEFDAIGRRIAYWLFNEHPGGSQSFGASIRVSADNVRHVFRPTRAGQVRAPSWFAPVLLRFRDFDEFEDATLMKQKIAACLSIVTSDPDGVNEPLGGTEGTDAVSGAATDMLEPGAIINLAPGRTVDVVQPPRVSEYSDYARTNLRAIATGLGVTYEDLTGDYADMPFSAARMSRLRHWARVEDWRWRIVIPQFCVPVFGWAMEAAAIMAQVRVGVDEDPGAIVAEWTGQPAPMIDPVNEGLAYQRNIRSGILPWQEAIRERGYDPIEVLRQMKEDMKAFDDAGIILDSDPRLTTQGGQLQGKALPTPAAPPAPAGDDEEVDELERAAVGRWRRR
jgi:lambda family phage portal protein